MQAIWIPRLFTFYGSNVRTYRRQRNSNTSSYNIHWWRFLKAFLRLMNVYTVPVNWNCYEQEKHFSGSTVVTTAFCVTETRKKYLMCLNYCQYEESVEGWLLDTINYFYSLAEINLHITCNAFEAFSVRIMYFKGQLYYILIHIYVNSSSRSLSKYLQKPIYFLICVKKDIAYDRNFLCVVSVVISPEWVHHSTSTQEQILCSHVDGVRI